MQNEHGVGPDVGHDILCQKRMANGLACCCWPSDLTDALNERRQDTEFMDRLNRHITEHKATLDRLAANDR